MLNSMSCSSRKMSTFIVLFLLLGVNLSTTTVEALNDGRDRGLSRKEDLEFERELKILNKPPIKSYIVGRDTIDCIDINEQPAFDHPLLKNHKIQMKPSFSIKKSTHVENMKPVRIQTLHEECPDGTVPIRRTYKEDLIRATILRESNTIVTNITFGQVEFTTQNLAGMVYYPDGTETVHGGGGDMAVYNLPVNDDQITAAHIAIESGYNPAKLNSIRFGWTVNPKLYGDHSTRMFVRWTVDGYQRTGCYNTLCPGFIQTNKQLGPGSGITDVSTYGGDQYSLHLNVVQDKETGNWWLTVSSQNVPAGYWPKEIFENLEGNETRIFWGGYTMAGADQTSPPMGSGHMPNDNPKQSCLFRNIKYADGSYDLVEPPQDRMVKKVECNLYGVSSNGYQEQYNFLFGGPGGKCT